MTTIPSTINRLRSCSPGILDLLHKSIAAGITTERCLQRSAGRVRTADRETSAAVGTASEQLMQRWGHLNATVRTPVTTATTGTSSSAGNVSTVEQGTGGMTRTTSEQSLSEVRAGLDDLLADAKNKYEDNVTKEVRDEVRNMRAHLRESDGLARKQSQASKQGLQRH